ncbi:DUF3961 domain-containing protein [Rummeliibacillus suwonensis]|nr:DUF3961 domain-containing protein [Rummeliibacillus suwonensis]
MQLIKSINQYLDLYSISDQIWFYSFYAIMITLASITIF